MFNKHHESLPTEKYKLINLLYKNVKISKDKNLMYQ